MNSNFPQDRKYIAEHQWLLITDDDAGVVGITWTAQDALGEIVYVELPEVGTRLVAGQVFGEVESTKTVSEIYAPISGEIIEVNQQVISNPTILNEDPYAAGWLIKAKIETLGELLTANEYQNSVGQ